MRASNGLVVLSLCLAACAPRTKPPRAPLPAPASAATTAVIGAQLVEDLEECPDTFSPEARSAWHDISGERYRIDAVGRPEQAITLLPPVAADARDEDCQGDVGRWGDAADPQSDYDGGHMIGSQLGGWGRRANMVPQERNFNRGNWAQLENTLADCADLEEGRIRYVVEVHYPNADTLIPDAMSMKIEDTVAGDSITLAFQNAPGGGPQGTETRRRGVEWLRARGCVE